MIREVRNFLSLTILLFASLLFSNSLSGHSLSSTALYLGYVLLILTFVVGIFLASSKFVWFWPAFLTLTIGSALVSSLLSIGFYLLLDYQPLDERRLYALGRLNNPVISAFSYGSALCLCLTAISRGTEIGLRLLLALTAVTLILSILLTGTRGAWIGLFAAIMCIATFREWSNRGQLLVSLSVLVTLPVLLVAVLYYFDLADAIFKRSFSFRPEIWSATITEWRSSNPLFGAGINSRIDLSIPPNTFMHPHSIYLSTLYYGGMIGLSSLIFLFGFVLKKLIQTAEQPSSQYAFPLFVFGSTVLLFDGNRIIEKIDFLWLCIWLPIGLTLVSVASASEQRIPESAK